VDSLAGDSRWHVRALDPDDRRCRAIHIRAATKQRIQRSESGSRDDHLRRRRRWSCGLIYETAKLLSELRSAAPIGVERRGLRPKFTPETPIIAVGDVFGYGSIDLFGVGLDGGVYTAWNHTGVWQGWRGPICPGGRFSRRTPVAAVSMKSGWIDLFAVGLDGAIWTAWYHDDPPWQGWGRIGGDFPQGTPVSAVSMRNGWIDLYVIGGADNAVYTWWHHDDPPWLTGRVGGKFAPGTPVTAVTDNKGWIDLFAVGLDGDVWTAWYHDAPWQGWGPVRAGGKFTQGTAVAAVSPQVGGSICSGWVWTATFGRRGITMLRGRAGAAW
jgi:hypothetical protein